VSNLSMKLFSLLFFLCSLVVCHGAIAAESRRPNVVFLLADDLGWGDMSCHGNSFIQTPNLDGLAQAGTDFHQFNTTSPVCSPSRAGFMTGKFPARFGIRSALGSLEENAGLPQVDWLDPKAVMLPRLLKEVGYITGHIGKWHLQSVQAGDAPAIAAYGVDEAALFAGSAYPGSPRTVGHDEIWDAAVDFLERNSAQPFYLNVWMHETHLAHFPSTESLTAYAQLDERQRIYAAVATDADRGVGQVLAALKRLGLEENTLVIFSSDNGPENTHESKKKKGEGYANYYSLGETAGRKGRKRSLHEGGINTPFIVRWPGRVPASRVDQVTSLSATDLLPTVCAAVGVPLPEGFEGDGENMLTAWQGGNVVRTKPIFWDWAGNDRPPHNWPRWAVRNGDWKLVTDNDQRAELYHIAEDRYEAHDLAEKHPEIVAQLRTLIEQWKATLPKEPSPAFVSQVGRKKNKR